MTTLVGRRVRLLHTSDPYTRRQPGALGTVAVAGSDGTLHVRWDDGGILGLIPDEDRWELLDEEPVHRVIPQGQAQLEDEGFWTHELGGEG